MPLSACGPMERMSKPRTLYSPPRNSFSKIGSSADDRERE
jgi:hypothetical protein